MINLPKNCFDSRKQIQKLAEVRKSSSAHSEHKKRQIIEMVRDETEEKGSCLYDDRNFSGFFTPLYPHLLLIAFNKILATSLTSFAF